MNNFQQQKEKFPELDDNEICYLEKKKLIGKPIYHHNTRVFVNGIMNKVIFGNKSKFYKR